MTISDEHRRNYLAAIQYLYSRINYERRPVIPYQDSVLKLERMERLVEGLGNPHRDVPSIHVAGSKGKGSTATMLASIAADTGFRTGLYTSPHLVQMEERIQLNGQNCSAEDLVQGINELRPIVARLDAEAARRDPAEIGPTFFELLTAIAFRHFSQRQADLSVMEVGLGGRLDSTNICQSRISVITSISLDHTRQLGNTLAKIAAEKAGIIRPGVPVVSGVTAPEAQSVIDTVAQRHDCKLIRLGHEFGYRFNPPTSADLKSSDPRRLIGSVDVWTWDGSCMLDRIRLGMFGPHQATNAAVAAVTAHEYRRAGAEITDDAIRSGIERAFCPARMEMISHRPDVFLDAAHNDASISAFLETLRYWFPARTRSLVFATTSGKDYREMLRQILPEFDRIIFTKYSNNPRVMSPTVLLRTARAYAASSGKRCQLELEPIAADAVELATRDLQEHDLLAVTGSFFLAGELRETLLRQFASSNSPNRHPRP